MIRNFMHRYFPHREFETYFRRNSENGNIEILIYLVATKVKMKGVFTFHEIEHLYRNRNNANSVEEMIKLANNRFQDVDPDELNTRTLYKDGFEEFDLPDVKPAA